MQVFDQSVSIKLSADVSWIPLVQSVVENGAPMFGLDSNKTMLLTLAVEEIVVHLAKTAPGTRISFSLEPGGWHVLANFSFKADPSDLWAMNIVAKTDANTQDGMDHLGLLLASRAVDRFTIRLKKDTVHLAMRNDRDYPIALPETGTRFQSQGKLTVTQNPEPALIKTACLRTLGLYTPDKIPKTFFTPGKVADMVAKKDMDIAVALDQTGALAGMICWRALSEQNVGFSGPYNFTTEEQTAFALTRHLINTVARTRAMGLFSELATSSLPTHNFESLGQLDLTTKDGRKFHRNLWYRHLREDMGTSIWAHNSYVEFLEEIYSHQVLMREIKITDDQGEILPEHSVFSAHLRPDIGEATLIPMVKGEDADYSVAQHVKMLRKEKFKNIFIRLDLAYGWQAAMGRVIMDNGFSPKLVLPYGGKSDILVFQHG